jgi:hypothetical protein
MLGFAVFAGMIVYLVFQCMHTRYDLVSKEYYKDELQYQQVIDGTNRANRLHSKATVTQQEHNIVIQLPGEMKRGAVTGKVWFYCADNAQKDQQLPLQVNSDATQTISSSRFVPGNYTVKISWQQNGAGYYTEVPLTIYYQAQ